MEQAAARGRDCETALWTRLIKEPVPPMDRSVGSSLSRRRANATGEQVDRFDRMIKNVDLVSFHRHKLEKRRFNRQKG